jgi:hypothetical protein
MAHGDRLRAQLGAVFALWPVMWIVVNPPLLFNSAVRSGRFDAFRTWVIAHLPNDRRVLLVVVGFCFGALLERIAGFGTPVAITSSLLILVGFPPFELGSMIGRQLPIIALILRRPMSRRSMAAGALCARSGRCCRSRAGALQLCSS